MSDNITTDLVIGGEARPAASGIVYDISTPARTTAIGRNFGVDGVVSSGNKCNRRRVRTDC